MIFSTGSIEQFHGSFKYLERRTSHDRNNNRYVEIIYQNDPEINLRLDLFSDPFYLDARSRDVQNTERVHIEYYLIKKSTYYLAKQFHRLV